MLCSVIRRMSLCRKVGDLLPRSLHGNLEYLGHLAARCTPLFDIRDIVLSSHIIGILWIRGVM